MKEELAGALRGATKEWSKAKRQADKDNRVRQRDRERLQRGRQRARLSLKDAAYMVMEEAYLRASANNTLPANARQIMYAARPKVLELTGGEIWKNSSYFTQVLLPDYIRDHPWKTADWDVVFDARGHLVEPHTDAQVGLGTVQVRQYVAGWTDQVDDSLDVDSILAAAWSIPTSGPAQRYRYAVFIEKEGFDQLLRAANLASRFDVAFFSTKGVSVTAARTLVEALSNRGVTILVVHDFDKSGLTILHTLRADTRRYQFRQTPNVVDLGLRLADAEAMGLEREPVTYDSNVNPRIGLRDSGATPEECDFLVKDGWARHWRGERVELNAMASDQFIAWLEGKLIEAGVTKVVPDDETLAATYRRAVRLAQAQATVARALNGVDEENITMPDELANEIRSAITDTALAWDEAIWHIAQRQVASAEDAA